MGSDATSRSDAHERGETPQRGGLVLWGVVAALLAGLLAYSQTYSYHGDESFHLVAAQLINAGKRPYLDFFYQHTPLHLYLMAGWFRFFGDTWRSAHALATLFTGAAIILVASYVLTRVRQSDWRVPAAIIAALLVGLHVQVVESGTVGQAYGLCLLLTVAAFRLTVNSVGRETGWPAVGAGLCAGAATVSSLLTIPVAPVLLLWMLRQNRAGSRTLKAAGFVAGVVVPFLPLVWLAFLGPQQLFFDLIEYHVFYRRSEPVSDLIPGELAKLSAMLLESLQGLLLALLAAVGLSTLPQRTPWEESRRAELSLCAWLTLSLGLLLTAALPTWPMYFVLLIPFLAIMASVGACAVGSAFWSPGRPGWLVALVVGLFVLGLAKPAFQLAGDFPHWRDREKAYEEVARTINRVTPPDGSVWADDEYVYFVARRLPPPGLENSYAQSVSIPAGHSARLRVFPLAQLEASVKAGRYATVALEAGERKVTELRLNRLYRGRTHMKGYKIFWGRRNPALSLDKAGRQASATR